MKKISVSKISSLKGALQLPGDKSISHRAIIFGALGQGQTSVTNFCSGEDTYRTVEAFRSLGIRIDGDDRKYTVHGKGLTGLKEPGNVIDAGNSGTTTRLITGLLSGQHFHTVITGDDSLRSRPMKRVTAPLRTMGARIDGRENGNYVPLAIRGTDLAPLTYDIPVASAQVKSALILAGLYANGTTEITEPIATRDHTERMLAAMGADIDREGKTIRVQGFPKLDPLTVQVPGDISSAAFFMVAATIVPGSEVLLRDVGYNPSRTGVIDILKEMGADIEITNPSLEGGEPKVDVLVRYGKLSAATIAGDMIPRAIDELPILAVAAAYAEGTTTIRDAKELRVKETDRIHAMVCGLRDFGATVEEFEDGMAVTGKEQLQGTTVSSFGDHRIAMALIVAGLAAIGETTVEGSDAIAISYPEFMDSLKSLIA